VCEFFEARAGALEHLAAAVRVLEVVLGAGIPAVSGQPMAARHEGNPQVEFIMRRGMKN